MLKKTIALFLCLVFVFGLVACGKNGDIGSGLGSSLDSQVQSGTMSQPSESKIDDDTKITPSSSTPTPSAPSGSLGNTELGSEEVDDNIVIEDTDTDDIDNSVNVVTSHTALSSDKYYQYSCLTSAEKQVYNVLASAAKNADNIIDLKSYNVNKDLLGKIFTAVITDNPQYFWVTNTYSYGYRGDDGRATYIILYYTDGTKMDEINNETLEAVNLADRSKIQTQIAEFNAGAKAVLDNISPSLSPVEKERKIHDYILKNTSYDSATANSYSGTGASPHPSFNAYGALVKNSAVCMGYAELFQYLCYQVGINVTQITGETSVAHMWSCVQLDNKWYHVDVTWDDASSNGYPIYEYFNVTEAQISRDHIIDNIDASVPEANSTEYSFDNVFGMRVASVLEAPQNYQNAMDYILENGEKYIIVNLNGNTVDNAYLRSHFIGNGSTVRKYAASKGYNISLAYGYITIGNYLYLIIEWE